MLDALLLAALLTPGIGTELADWARAEILWRVPWRQRLAAELRGDRLEE